MGNLLYLVHRLPFPPNKGDKVRSFHLLKHLVAKHRVYLGTFVDDPEDEGHVETVRKLCVDMHVVRLKPSIAKFRSLSGLLTNDALSVRYYKDEGLREWVNRILTDCHIDGVVVFSSVMAQYFENRTDECGPVVLVDFVDVDSAKWAQYAPNHMWPLSWLYRREGIKLLEYERHISKHARRSFFVTENERLLFQKLAPETSQSTEVMSNGVDADYFSPSPNRDSPFAPDDPRDRIIPIVFTGAMDYWPNIDAVSWFVHEMLPILLKSRPIIRFYIVGRAPTPAVLSLASDSVIVTGTVPDVRPYLQHATVVVAPLRVARGIQNKILEAMAMERPVVASHSCVQAIDSDVGQHVISALTAADFVREIDVLLEFPSRANEVGTSGRIKVVASYSWAAHLAGIDKHLNCTESVQIVERVS